MIRLKNYDKTVVGIGYSLFTITLDTTFKPRKLYNYCLYSFFRKKMVSIEFSGKKLVWYNKYTLPVVCVAFNFVELLAYIFYYPILYFIGLHDFFSNTVIGRGRDLFLNVNFFGFIALLIWQAIKHLLKTQ